MVTLAKKKPVTKSTVAKTTKSAPKVVPVKPIVAPVAKSTQPEVKPLSQAFAKTEKADKAKKPKMVRDSFTFPKAEYAVLDELKQRAVKLAQPIKKGELLRAGIKALTSMSDAAFLQAIKAVPAIKTGRPKKA